MLLNDGLTEEEMMQEFEEEEEVARQDLNARSRLIGEG